MKSASRFACFGVALAALLMAPAIASADRGHRYDRGDRYVRSSSRSSIGVSVGFGWGSHRHSGSFGSISYNYQRPVYRHYDYSPRYYERSADFCYSPRVYAPRVYTPAPVVIAPPPVIVAPRVVYSAPTYYYAAPRTHYYTPTYTYRSYDYCAPRYYYHR